MKGDKSQPFWLEHIHSSGSDTICGGKDTSPLMSHTTKDTGTYASKHSICGFRAFTSAFWLFSDVPVVCRS